METTTSTTQATGRGAHRAYLVLRTVFAVAPIVMGWTSSSAC